MVPNYPYRLGFRTPFNITLLVARIVSATYHKSFYLVAVY